MRRALAIAVLILIAAASAQGQQRDRTINIYNWSDYVEPTVVEASPRKPASR